MPENFLSSDFIFHRLPVGVYRISADGKILMANPFFVSMLGFSSFDELENRNIEKIIFQDQADRLKLKERIESEGEVTDFESVWLRKNHTMVHVSEFARAVRNAKGKIIYYEGIVEDITQRKFDSADIENYKLSLEKIVKERTEDLRRINLLLKQEIRQRKKTEGKLTKDYLQYQSLIENTSDWIWEINKEGLYTFSSPNIEEILGYHPQEILGKTPFNFIIPEKKTRIQQYFNNVAEANISFKNLFNTLVHKNGKLVFMETSGVPFFDTDGNLAGYRGIDRDITEQHFALQALKKTEQKLSQHVKLMPIGYIEWDLNKEVIDWNPVASKIFGYSKTEALREKIFDKIILNDVLSEFDSIWKRIISGEEPLHGIIKNRTKNGLTITCEWFLTTIREPGGKILAIITLVNEITNHEKTPAN